MKKYCTDCYGEKLKIGDKVIPIMDEALIIGVGGIITDIIYSEKYDNYYITLSNKDKNILLRNVDSKCYTTEERFNERERNDYIYQLTFFNSILRPITFLPLTNKTNIDYDIPEDTRVVQINSNYLVKKSNSSKSYINETVMTYIVENGIIVSSSSSFCNKKVPGIIGKDNYWIPINCDYRILEDKKELENTVRNIIKYFNNANLSNINNNTIYSENKEVKEFERKLIKHLK